MQSASADVLGTMVVQTPYCEESSQAFRAQFEFKHCLATETTVRKVEQMCHPADREATSVFCVALLEDVEIHVLRREVGLTHLN